VEDVREQEEREKEKRPEGSVRRQDENQNAEKSAEKQENNFLNN